MLSSVSLLSYKLHQGRDLAYSSLTSATLIIGTWEFVKFYRLTLESYFNLPSSAAYIQSLVSLTSLILPHRHLLSTYFSADEVQGKQEDI